ncbi:hypothetical protein GH5_00520 [Leishmania sp. Ghana 2012 LV757]|uniref:hypothetical protein n=1 Tax=Leishmania sp. Ghana 2012 LV757 TaxID=2803181 RepID=UPI001B54628D|nr:hypothetical protein GH5_00520 [Leishmania sp. Ghana 2012 LV757]
MEAPSTAASADVDLYVLEYVANMRWLLRYATSELDPTVEQHYPDFVAQVVELDVILSRITFERSCRLGDLPFGIVRLSREAMLYLLVSDHLLGGCPPTMHPFLQQAFGARAKGAVRRPTRRSPVSADLNVSFQSDDEDGGKESDPTRFSAELDAQPLAAIDPSSEEMSTVAAMQVQGKETQAMLLLLRWLFSEGVLSEDEMLETVNVSRTGDGSSNSHMNAPTPAEAEYERFCRHQQLAHHLAEMIPFYLGAHLLVSRSLLLQCCATLLTTEAVMQHVAHLRTVVPSAASRSRLSAALPPSSVEGALLEWLQAIVDSINASEDGAAVLARLRDCSTLRAFIQCGPFCEDVMDPSDRDFFRLVQSGESVCVALLFYFPDSVPLTWLSTALRTVEAGVRESLDAGLRRERLQRQLSLCYWTAIIAAMRQVGVWVLLSPEEIVTYGRTALPLHLFYLIQQLFAVLATNAEEEVRVSADTAWWEQMKSREGLTEMMKGAGADAASGTEEWSDTSTTAVTMRSGTGLSGAQRVLRKSMQDTFVPAVLTAREAGDDDSVAEHDHEEVDRPGRLLEMCTVAQPLSPARTTASRATEEFHSLRTGVEESVGGEGGTNEGTTQFSIKEAHTQCEGQISSKTARDDTFETAIPVLRPMVSRSSSTLTRACDATSRTATMTASLDRLAAFGALHCQDVLRRTDSRAAVFGEHAIDTYARAEEKNICDGCASARDSVAVQAALEMSDPHPTSADTLLHTRAVDSGLRRCSVAAYAELATMATGLVGVPVVKASEMAAMFSNKQDKATLSLHCAGGDRADSKDDFVMVHPNGVPRCTLSTSACAPERSTSSSLTHSTDFVQRMLSPTTQEAHEAAKEISRSSDLSDLIRPSPAATDSQHAADMSPPSPLRTPVTGTAVPTAESTQSMTFPLPANSIPTGLATPGKPKLLFPKRDTEEGDESADADTAAPTCSSSASSAHLPYSREPLSTVQDKAAVAAKSPAAGAALLAASLVPVRESAVTLSKALASFPSRENHSSSPCSRKSRCIESTAVKQDDVSLLRGEAEISPHATSPERRSWPLAEESERCQLPWHAPHKRTSMEGSRKVAGDSLPPLSHKRASARADGDELCHVTRKDKEGFRASSPCNVLSSPVFPGAGARRAPRHTVAGKAEQDIRSRTASEATNSPELSPLTRVPAQNLSDVYGSVYASLLEDMAASDVDILRRCHRTTAGSSWHSSVSWPYHRSLRSTADSVASAVSSSQNTAQVQELLDRLSGNNMADLVDKDKQELRRALAQQQAVVDELRSALHGRSVGAGSRERFYHARHRPTLQRRRKPQMRLSVEETHGRGATAVTEARRTLPHQVRSSSVGGAVTQDSFMSAMTTESGLSEAYASRSDFPGQATEADVLSTVKSPLPPTSASPPESCRRRL